MSDLRSASLHVCYARLVSDKSRIRQTARGGGGRTLQGTTSSVDEPRLLYRFGEFVLETDGVLRGASGEIRLRPQAFRLLVALVSRPDQVLSHDQLIDEAWGVHHLSPSALKQTISELRRALGDSADRPRFIQTLPRRGYRFLEPVEVEEAGHGLAKRSSRFPTESESDADAKGVSRSFEGTQEPGERRHRPWSWPTWAVGIGLVAASWWWLSNSSSGDRPAVDESGQHARPVATVFGFASETTLRGVGDDLARLVFSELTGSGTQSSISATALDLARKRIVSPGRLESRILDLGQLLEVDMLLLGDLSMTEPVADTSEQDEERRLTARLVVFDTRTGQPGAYAVAHGSVDRLAQLAHQLIDNLWAWDEALVPVAESPMAPLTFEASEPLDARAVSARASMQRGTVLRQLRQAMADLRESSRSRPRRPPLLR